MPTDVTVSVPDDLYPLIQAQAERQYRTVDGQILWLVARQLGVTGAAAEKDTDGVRAFKESLLDLHIKAGEPSSRVIAADIGSMSHTTVNEALRGAGVPSWRVIERIVSYLGGDVGQFRALWSATRGTPRRR